MLYVGHGCFKEGKPHAIAADGMIVNLQMHFLSALNKAHPAGVHSIVLLMDSCLSPARLTSSHTSSTPGTNSNLRATDGLASGASNEKSLFESRAHASDGAITPTSTTHSGNLILFSHSYLQAHVASEGDGRFLKGSWTNALLRSMSHQDDLLAILQDAASEMRQHDNGNAWKPWYFYKRGVHSRCSIARFVVYYTG
jgi:hypothetical protein